MLLIAKIYAIVVAAVSLVTFGLFWIDKRRAIRESGNRIPEKTLFMAALLGGWPGALAGQKLFRHKTVKGSFRVVLTLIVGLHLAMIAGWVWLWLQR